ncbi:MAG: flavodoxin family protein [Firmicutes bacterium]|nr:flavodoxin family protein [Bacillota bacterium]
MKIIILNGSPRKHGSTANILHRMEDILKSKAADVTYYDLGEESIAPCRGCCACYKNGDCFIQDSADELSSALADADGIIIGSPTYASNISGVLKNFIDRGHFVIEQLLYGKYAVSLTTYENYGGGEASKILNRVISYSGGRMSGSLTVKIPFGGSNVLNLRIENKIQKTAERLYNDIAVGKRHVFQSIRHRIVFEIGIRPFVMRKGDDYAGVLNYWKTSGLIK